METNLSRMMEARINPQLEDVELNDDGTEQTEEQFQEMIEKVRARARARAQRGLLTRAAAAGRSRVPCHRRRIRSRGGGSV